MGKWGDLRRRLVKKGGDSSNLDHNRTLHRRRGGSQHGMLSHFVFSVRSSSPQLLTCHISKGQELPRKNTRGTIHVSYALGSVIDSFG